MQDLAPDTEAADAADVELVRRMSDGESAALDGLFSRHAGRVNGLLLRMLGSSGEAEEALQDVFLQAWTRASTFRPDKGTPRAWLMVIARSRALDRLRSGRAARRRDEEALRETSLVAEADAELAVERRELGASMRRLLGELPAEQRQAIELAFFAGLTHSECAERLGVPLGTLKSRILMGMKKLKQGLDTYRGRR